MSKTTIDLDDALDQRLRIYMRASGNKLATIVRQAIGDYIIRELQDNEGVNRKFEAERARVLASAGVAQLTPRRRSKKKVLGEESGMQTEAQKPITS